MKAADAQSLRIEINPGETVSALLIRPPQARACYVFAHGAGAGMTHSSMEAIADGSRRARDRDAALSISLHGEGQQAARCAQGRACRRPRRGGGSRAMLSLAAADRGRQIVRRADDLAGAGAFAVARRSRAGIFRLSAASGRQAFQRPRRASRRSQDPDAVPAGHARCAGGTEPARARRQGPGHRGPRCICSMAPIIPFTC